MFGLGMQELIIIGIIAVLLFGKRLPEVARGLGKSYNQFKQGLSEFTNAADVTKEVYSSNSSAYRSHSSSYSYDDIDDHDEATAPRFEPPPAEPKAE